MSACVRASKSDTVGWVAVGGGSVSNTSFSLSKCPELGKSMVPPGNESRQSGAGYSEKSLREAWKNKQTPQ